ncbi:MAG: hypothetical protein M1818_005541 [Claussenomyces sp. TS43310]|nr:MAG: hypothetical protein M1818_005541 [Claussenomyces sp. TS43310]
MADLRHSTDGPSPLSPEGYDERLLPDYDVEFVSDADIAAFAKALSAPETSPSTEDLSVLAPSNLKGGSRASLGASRSSDSVTRAGSSSSSSQPPVFITAQHDWAPVHERIKPAPRRRKEKEQQRQRQKQKRKARSQRSTDETREGYLYSILKWPLLAIVGAWVVGLAISYLWTRLYIWFYEYFVAWRGERARLRKRLEATTNYGDWVVAAKGLDKWAGGEEWKRAPAYAYYDDKTVRRVLDHMRRARRRVENDETQEGNGIADGAKTKPIEELKSLIEACVKDNFAGVENPRLYSQTYYGTKDLVQDFTDEVEASITTLMSTTYLSPEEKRSLFKRISTNFGRTALCLSGGASFAYYHFGVIKALLDADLLPEVITGTSGGALVAALIATRTNDELKALLVPALAGRINACSEPFSTWLPRWWKTGARFDSVDWARRCSWFSRGSMTFREAYERTGRILNVSCVPADPHSPTILTNYLTSPDCVIWSAVLASAAVPGILNPVVLMMKQRDGTLAPYSFGHKWKDGSLRTDIPLKALNLHFNVNFSIVSQVNPHINLFFFSSRGTVGQPVTHRRGKGWRGGFLGSATEQYLKLDLNKWLKVVRHLELLPRPLGQDWSQVWLQAFTGTITIWPRSRISDFWRILTDPDAARFGRMLHVGQQSAFPKLKFIGNRLKVERQIERGRRETRPSFRRGSIESIMSEDDMRRLLRSEAQTDEETDATGTGDEMEDGPRIRGDEELLEAQLRDEAKKVD